eukprot:TRINITY_DN33221_c0_g1_i1.p1 TRINITY_DN33221_c0_g1~~TRINITY_DN33221_c0_g1_i1.p1  ORF type:complete len:492 (+),score=54.82 TRINITY_DN33221_c0_g1_i1:113-1477(+)
MENGVHHRMSTTSRNDPILPRGHVALLQAHDSNCENAFSKVQKLVGSSMFFSGQAKLEIQGRILSASALEHLELLVSNVTTEEALEQDDVLTSQDLSILASCELGLPDNWLEEKEFTASGNPILQGDMAADENTSRSFLQLEQAIAEGQAWAGPLWQGGTVPWCFHPTVSYDAKMAWSLALEHVAQRTCLQFQELSANGPDRCSQVPSVIVQSSDSGCYSYVGEDSYFKFAGKSQPLNLGRGCEFLGIAVHEIGHAIGMAHEQSRPDRDNYMTVHWDNIPRDKAHNFAVNSAAYVGDRYDYFSLMQYDPHAFAINREKRTLDATDEHQTRIMGQRHGFSSSDTRQIMRMYGCSGSRDTQAGHWCLGKSFRTSSNWLSGRRCFVQEHCISCTAMGDGLPDCTAVNKGLLAPGEKTACRGPPGRGCRCEIERMSEGGRFEQTCQKKATKKLTDVSC